MNGLTHSFTHLWVEISLQNIICTYDSYESNFKIN